MSNKNIKNSKFYLKRGNSFLIIGGGGFVILFIFIIFMFTNPLDGVEAIPILFLIILPSLLATIFMIPLAIINFITYSKKKRKEENN